MSEKYSFMMTQEGEMSLEQLYKMLHVSKRKAAWMLNNGIIPCQIRPTKTHRYIILREDVEAYLQKKRAERRKEIPVGIFNAKPTKQKVVINNNRPMDTVDLAECFITIADECKDEFRAHVEKRLQYFPDAITADKAADIMGYAKNTVHSYIQQKRIFAVQISGKYILPKSALVEFLVDDFAFEIIHKSTWHINTILTFTKKNKPNYTNEDDF
jgi:hypothetical protein